MTSSDTQPTDAIRKLAAVMFTDIVGYTAFQLLKKNREIHKPLIEKYEGKWIKEMGDGVLAQFDSAYNATRCAIEIQEKSKQEFRGELRIGLHLGEIIIENNDRRRSCVTIDKLLKNGIN